MVKAQGLFCISFPDTFPVFGILRKFHSRLCIQDLFHTSQAGHSTAHSNDQVCQFYQFYQDLAHVVYQRDNISAHQHTGIH